MNQKQLRFDAAFAQLHLSLSGKTATVVMYHDLVITVAYHDTHVARLFYNKQDTEHFTIRLESDGRLTPTIKRRINQVFTAIGAQWRIVQEGKVWYVVSNEFDSIRLPFVDGMTLLV